MEQCERLYVLQHEYNRSSDHSSSIFGARCHEWRTNLEAAVNQTNNLSSWPPKDFVSLRYLSGILLQETNQGQKDSLTMRKIELGAVWTMVSRGKMTVDHLKPFHQIVDDLTAVMEYEWKTAMSLLDPEQSRKHTLKRHVEFAVWYKSHLQTLHESRDNGPPPRYSKQDEAGDER